jgi:hypothetical protein
MAMLRKSGVLFVGASLIFIITLFILVATLWSTWIAAEDNKWTIERIEEALAIKIPQDARELRYEGAWGRMTYLDLAFLASPESVITFVNHFCEGALIENYNPFNAIFIRDAVAHPWVVTINMDIDIALDYYTYSPNTPDSVSGNICYNNDGETFLVQTDRLRADLSRIHLVYSHMGAGTPGFDIKPIENSPFMFRGNFGFSAGYTIKGRSLCIDLDPIDMQKAAFASWRDADIFVRVGSEELPAAFISGEGNLKPANSGTNTEEIEVHQYFSYCYDLEQTESGLSQIGLLVMPPDGNTSEHIWEVHIN